MVPLVHKPGSQAEGCKGLKNRRQVLKLHRLSGFQVWGLGCRDLLTDEVASGSKGWLLRSRTGDQNCSMAVPLTRLLSDFIHPSSGYIGPSILLHYNIL